MGEVFCGETDERASAGKCADPQESSVCQRLLWDPGGISGQGAWSFERREYQWSALYHIGADHGLQLGYFWGGAFEYSYFIRYISCSNGA